MVDKAAKKKEKSDADQEQAAKSRQSVEQLVLDKKLGKYEVVDRISYWAKQLRKLEEHRHKAQTDILELAMAEVLGGKVSEDELEKQLLAAEAANGQDKEAEKPKKKI